MSKARQTWQVVVLVTAIAVVISAVAEAGAPAPPWRGQDGSTYQKWTFDTDANPADPSAVSNPYGPTSASITVGDMGGGWFDFLPGFGTQTGIWDLGSLGTISIDLPNRPYDGGFKEIWISVVCFEDPGWMAAPTVDVMSAGQITFLGEETYLVEEDPISGQWNAHLSRWLIVPNPNLEQVVITADMFGSIIDEIEIDTVCVPEPASLAALLIGGPLLLALRRRKA